MKLSPRMLAATIAATMFTSGLIMTADAEARPRYGNGLNQATEAYDALTPEKQAQYDAIMKDFADRTSSLREKLRAKRIELETLGRSSNVDPKAVQAASQEMASLQTQMGKERAALRDRIAKEVGIDISAYGRYGRGGCGGGQGYHHGYNGHYNGDGCAPGHGVHHSMMN